MFIAKLVANGVIVIASLMLITDATFLESLITAVVSSVLAYTLGDWMILPRSNNLTATFSDMVLSGLVLWIASSLFSWDLSLGELPIPVVLLGLFEYGFHVALLKEMGIEDQSKTNAPT